MVLFQNDSDSFEEEIEIEHCRDILIIRMQEFHPRVYQVERAHSLC